MKNKKFLNWIDIESGKYDLQIIETADFPIKSFHDLQATIRINDVVFTGHGTDTDEDIALQKAVCEAIERSITSDIGIYPTSNGIAGHVDQKQAQINARNELIERDSFLFHYICNIAPQQLQIKNKLHEEMAEIFPSIVFENYRLSCDKTHHSILTVAKMGKRGIIISLGCDQDYNTALNNSLIQICRKVFYVEKHGVPELKSNSIETVEDHFAFGFTHEGMNQFEKMIATEMHNRNNNLKSASISTTMLKPTSKTLKELQQKTGLKFFKAHEKGAQELFFGTPGLDKINIAKFNKILNGQELLVPYHPHIFA